MTMKKVYWDTRKADVPAELERYITEEHGSNAGALSDVTVLVMSEEEAEIVWDRYLRSVITVTSI